MRAIDERTCLAPRFFRGAIRVDRHGIGSVHVEVPVGFTVVTFQRFLRWDG